MFELRAARPDDAEVVAALAEVLGYTVSPAECRERLARLSSSPDREVAVAEVEGRVRGWVEVARFESLTSPPAAQIVGLVVDPETRGLGLGRRLVEWSEAWARGRGLSALRLRSRQHRVEAHAFYLHLGFEKTKEQSLFVRSLSPG